MNNVHKDNAKSDSVRLDKWLWAARFYKTRSIAKEMIDGGKVHYNGQRSKPNKNVEIGAMIKLRQGNEEKEVEVIGLSSQRRGFPEAQQLYRETEKSIVEPVYLKRVTRTSFEDGLFSGWHNDPEFVLNQDAFRNGSVLVAGPDFGTGSSREHAVWALMEYFRNGIAASCPYIFAQKRMQCRIY